MKNYIIILMIFCLQLQAQTWEKQGNNKNYFSIYMKGQNIITGTFKDGVMMSNDLGKTWNPRNVGLSVGNYSVYSVAFNDYYSFAACFNGLFRSTDLGITWTVVNSGKLKPGAVGGGFFNVSKNEILYYEGDCLFNSVDYGLYWDLISCPNLYFGNILTIKLIGNKLLNLISEGDLNISLDSGFVWNKINGIIKNLNSFFNIGTDLYIGTKANGIFYTTDFGTNWIPINNGLPNLNITSISNLGDNIFFAACKGNGVYISYDKGENWSSFNSGLTDSTNISYIEASENYILAITDSSDFYSNNLSFLGVDDGVNINNELSVSPNPVIDFLNLSSGNNFGKIEIYSALSIKLLEAEYTSRIDVSQLPTGLYFLKAGFKILKFIKN